jgi:hypothetical protein
MKKWIESLEPRGLIRRLILSWMAGVTVAYLILPASKQSLAGLSALADTSSSVILS